MKHIVSVFILMLVFLTGCSISGRYYLRNFQNTPVHAILFSETFENNSEIQFGFSPEIQEIKKNTGKHLTDTIRGITKQNAVEICLPPHSTTLIGYGINGRLINIDSIVIITNQGKQTYTSSSFKDFNFRGGFMGYTAHIDVTD